MENRFRESLGADPADLSLETSLREKFGLSIDEIPELDADYNMDACAADEGMLIGENRTWAVFMNILWTGPSEPRDEWYGKPEMFFKIRLTDLADETLQKVRKVAGSL